MLLIISPGQIYLSVYLLKLLFKFERLLSTRRTTAHKLSYRNGLNPRLYDKLSYSPLKNISIIYKREMPTRKHFFSSPADNFYWTIVTGYLLSLWLINLWSSTEQVPVMCFFVKVYSTRTPSNIFCFVLSVPIMNRISLSHKVGKYHKNVKVLP